LDEAGILTISLVTDPTYGGVAASFATLCDVIIAEPAARLGFAGPRGIKPTIQQTLPPGFQTGGFLLENWLNDIIRRRSALRATLATLLSLGQGRPPARAGRVAVQPAACETGVVVRDHTELAETDAWQNVQKARDLNRPTTMDYLRWAFDDFEE